MKKHGIKYSVLTCQTVLVQTLKDMCSDAHVNTLFSVEVFSFQHNGERHVQYTMTKKTDIAWKDGAFVSIMKEYDN